MAIAKSIRAPGIQAWRAMMWVAIGGLLVLPAVAMQFTREVAWDRADFAAAALLLVGAGIVFEIGSRVASSSRFRILLGFVIFAVVALIWVDAAVGIF